VVIESDMRVFTTVAALNVAGFDVELGPQYHPARVAVRRIAEKLDPDLTARLREFYNRHKGGQSDEEQLSKYVSLASVLTSPPELKPVSREEGLPGPAREVLGFAELVREFYQKAAIIQRWVEVREVYDAEMDRIGAPIRNAILRSDSYLRVPLGGPSAHTMRITVELSAPQNSVNVRNHDNDYLVVLGYSSEAKVEEVRHAYLHLRLNDVSALHAASVERRDTLPLLLTGQQGVSREYSSSFYSMMTESLIRAVELRLDRVPAPAALEAVRNHYRTGLLLIPYFYEALQRYEASDGPLGEELGKLAEAIDIGKETERFKQTFHTIPLPERQSIRAEVPVPVRPDPVAELLKVGQSAFEKDKRRAREAFETVLKEHDANNGRALYGLGLIALGQDPPSLEEAQRHFELAVKSNSTDLSMRTWSHIHLGHILDFNCNRPGAVENYRKAIATGDNTSNARAAAEEGLAKPYGGGCQQ
jgi:tetratricopeptide (TPR) repeat protein